MSVEPILTARQLVKRYGRVTALDHCDFDLYPGEILAVIGDNGAGKSTLIKAICGAVIPDSGEIRLGGEVVHFTSPIAARATATPCLWPPDSVSTGWWMFWIVISPSSFNFSRANFAIRARSVARNHCPMKPGMRGSRPRNMLSAMDSAGDSASV